MQVHLSAIIERADAGFSVFFPDLPGCVSAGATGQAAAINAGEALAFHLAGMIEDGDAVPEPTPLDAMALDREGSEVGRVLVVGEKPGRSVRLSITMGEALIGAIDRVAANRSGLLADAARAALAARGRWGEPCRRGSASQTLAAAGVGSPPRWVARPAHPRH